MLIEQLSNLAIAFPEADQAITVISRLARGYVRQSRGQWVASVPGSDILCPTIEEATAIVIEWAEKKGASDAD